MRGKVSKRIRKFLINQTKKKVRSWKKNYKKLNKYGRAEVNIELDSALERKNTWE